MMTVLSGTRSQLSTCAEKELANYRYEVFVETLQWQLPAEDGLEFDQFDRARRVSRYATFLCLPHRHAIKKKFAAATTCRTSMADHPAA